MSEAQLKDILQVCAAIRHNKRPTYIIYQDIPSKVSFTFDAWTSDPGDPFLSVTGHYIFVRPDRPNDWELRTEQLAFTPLCGRHSGANMASLLVLTVDHYDLHGKVSTFVFFMSSITCSYSDLAQLVYI